MYIKVTQSKDSLYVQRLYVILYVWFGKVFKKCKLQLHNSFNSIISNRNWNYLTVSSSLVTMAWLWHAMLCHAMIRIDVSLSLNHRPVVCFEGRGEIYFVFSLLLLFLTMDALFALDIFYTSRRRWKCGKSNVYRL